MFSEPYWTENEQWAHSLIALFCLFVRLITSRCQLQGSGAAGLKNAQATCRLPGARSCQLAPAASGFQGHTKWLLVNVRARTHSETNPPAHMFMHYFYTFVRVHTCLHQGRHTWFPICAHTQAWLNTLAHAHTVLIHTRTPTKTKIPHP